MSNFFKKGFEFTSEEEQEYQEIVTVKPQGFVQHLSVFFDRIMNSIWMFMFLIAYSMLGAIFPQYLTPLLYWSNTYQLSSLPIVAIAATLGTTKLMRLVFRIYLNQRAEAQQREEQRIAEIQELKQMHAEQQRLLAELTAAHQELHELVKQGAVSKITQIEGTDTGR